MAIDNPNFEIGQEYFFRTLTSGVIFKPGLGERERGSIRIGSFFRSIDSDLGLAVQVKKVDGKWVDVISERSPNRPSGTLFALRDQVEVAAVLE